MRDRCRVGIVCAAMATILLPDAASGALPPTVETELREVQAEWEEGPAGRYPLTITYEGRLTTNTDAPAVFAEDTWGETRWLRLADLAPDAAPDAITAWTVRGRVSPVKLELLNDLGVNFHVADVAPFGTSARFGQGAVHDLYFWAGAAAGSQAAQGNVNEDLVVNTGMPVVFPERPPAGTEGHLEWEHLNVLGTPTSTAFDPTTGSTYSTTLVSHISTSFLKVVGGDLTQPSEAEPFHLDLPEEADPRAVLSIYPSALPGVDMDLSLEFPNIDQLDFHELIVHASASPADAWPESRSVGPLREWMWRPTIVAYGDRRTEGAASLIELEAPLPAGSEAVALTVDGTVERVGPYPYPGILRVVNLAGRQELTFLPSGSGPSGDPASPAEGEAPPPGSGMPLGSPAVRGVAAEGVVSGTLVDRGGLPVLEGLSVGERSFGDLAVPAIRVDDEVVPVTWDRLEGVQVVPTSFGNAEGTSGGSGFVLQLLVRTDGALVEAAVAPAWRPTSELVELYLLNVSSLDGASHSVDVDWYSGPPGDHFTAGGQRVPVEILTHEEFNGDIAAENRPDIQAVDAETGEAIRYFLVTPTVLYQSDADGAHGLWALVRDEGIAEDPVAEVDGEDLEGDVALYARVRSSGFGEQALPFQSWLRLSPT